MVKKSWDPSGLKTKSIFGHTIVGEKTPFGSDWERFNYEVHVGQQLMWCIM